MALRDRRDLLLHAGLALFALVLGGLSLLLRPDRHRAAEAFLFGDQGYNLWVAQRILAGETLFAEVAYQYGPLPAYLHAGAAGLFGNTIATFNLYFLAVSTLNVVLASLLIRSVASRTAVALVVGVGLSASLLVPASLLGGTTNSTYVPLERTVVLLTTLLWTPPWARTARRYVLLGLVIGGWQLVRFGGGVFLGCSLVLVDLLSLWWARSTRRGSIRAWWGGIARTVAAAVAVQALLTVFAFLLLPREIARDLLWPSYVLESYEGWLTPELRWPRWGGWPLLVGQYLTPLLGAASGIAALIWYLGRPDTRSDARADRAIGLLIPLVFFAIASVGLFRMAYHFLMFAWALVIPAAWLYERVDRPGKLFMAVLMVPCFILNLKTIFVARPDALRGPFQTPSGEVVWGTEAQRDQADRIAARISFIASQAGRGSAPAAIVLPIGAGFHSLYGIGSPLRQLWFLPGLVRPYDEEQLVSSLDRVDAIVVRDPAPGVVGTEPCSWRTPPLFTPRGCAEIAAHLGASVNLGGDLVYSLGKGDPSGVSRDPAERTIPAQPESTVR